MRNECGTPLSKLYQLTEPEFQIYRIFLCIERKPTAIEQKYMQYAIESKREQTKIELIRKIGSLCHIDSEIVNEHNDMGFDTMDGYLSSVFFQSQPARMCRFVLSSQ